MKTFFLVIGSALAGIVLFVAAAAGYVYYRMLEGAPLPSISFSGGRYAQPKQIVSAPPEIPERFLGTTGSIVGEFSSDRDKVLAGGPGVIAGSVTSAGKPAQGLRLRLALNGSVMSAWAETDAGGRYAVSVPYGKYRVDGFELDSSSAHAVLKGKTDGPRFSRYDQDVMMVSEGQPGTGPALQYVDPVRKKGPRGEVSLARPVIVEWEPYPNAGAYRIQLTEQEREDDYANRRQVFDWRARPTVPGTSLNLGEAGVQLKAGYRYTVDIEVLDSDKRVIAATTGYRDRPDFVVAR